MAYEVANQALGVPLDVLVVRKLGVPHQEELAFGAIASGGVRVLNRDVIAEMRLSAERIAQITREEQRELDRRERLYRGDSGPLAIRGKTVLIVDDGLATGATMRAAVQAVRQLEASPVAAVPVAAEGTRAGLERVADAVVCGITPEPFVAVGRWYCDFDPTSDEEVRQLLALARER